MEGRELMALNGLNKSGDILWFNSVEEWEINGYVNFGSD